MIYENENSSGGAIIVEGNHNMEVYGLLAIRSALKLESLGLKGRLSAKKAAEEKLGVRCKTRKDAMIKLEAHIEQFTGKPLRKHYADAM